MHLTGTREPGCGSAPRRRRSATPSCRSLPNDIIPPITAAARSIGIRTITEGDYQRCREPNGYCPLDGDSVRVILYVSRAAVTDTTARVQYTVGDAGRNVELTLTDGRWVVTRIR